VVEGSECEPWHGNIDPGGGREVGKHVEGRGSLLIHVGRCVVQFVSTIRN